MKRSYILNFLVIPAAVCALVFAFSAFSVDQKVTETKQVVKSQHKNTAAELVTSKKSTESFRDISMFSVKSGDNTAANQFAQNVSSLKIDSRVLSSLNSTRPESMTLKVPAADGRTVEVELVKTDYLPTDFKIKNVSANGTKYETYEPGTYYTGVIKGDNTSIATFSVYKNSVMGIFSTNEGNYVLGSVKDANKNLSEDYIFYNDNDAVNKPAFDCGSGDTYDKFYKDPIKFSQPTGDNSGRTISPVDIYFVCDYQMYLDNGSSTTAVGNFVSGAFAHVRTLYLNEGLTVALSSDLTVYTSPDPYRNLNESPAILELFGDNTRNGFNGDLAHLLSTGHGQSLGGIAWINVLCQSYEPASHSGKYAFSNIEGNYSPYPTFSWTVMVITHETGHNFGSMHTHACVWPTTSGQIDSCYASEGGCVSGTRPNNNGTVMSYCHLNGAINLTRGFGSLPHDTIVDRYDKALCLDNPINSSETPVAFKLSQNYPNPFNPATNIRFALPQDGFVTMRIFDVTGREIAKLVNGQYYAIGFYSVTLDAAALNLASGVYLYKLDVTRDNNSVYSEIKKMVLIK